jgi:hypothetical protein
MRRRECGHAGIDLVMERPKNVKACAKEGKPVSERWRMMTEKAEL